MNPLIVAIFGLVSLTSLMFWRNFALFRRLPAAGCHATALPAVSVLIPARDEADGIADSLASVLANSGIEFEVVVLDDQSRDGTAEIVRAVALRDPRVRLVEGQTLPPGWCGKQFACHQLAREARFQELLFLDADVRLEPDALVRAVGYRQGVGVDLLSGFPRQVVGTVGESLLVPLVYIVLLSYLPFDLMRRTRWVAAGAGCGQFFLTTRRGYDLAGGHRAIRGSLHDGITLPRAYRRAGLSTDLFDAADVARCRMYRGWQQTWNGFRKNAYEGMANERLIGPMTVLLLLGYVAPTVAAVVHCLPGGGPGAAGLAVIAAGLSYLPRLVTAARYDGAWLSATLFPALTVLLVILQWTALVQYLQGSTSSWRGRAYTPPPAGASESQ